MISDKESALFNLIRIGLNRDEVQNNPLCKDLQSIKDIAFKQGVGNIVFDGIKKILLNDSEQKLSQNVDEHTLRMMEWFGYTNLSIRQYEQNKKITEKLGSFYSLYDIPMMLLKGYGLSLNYPIPPHRPSGDVDIYLFGQWKKADILMSTDCGIVVDNSHHHHSVFQFEGQSVENHYDFINVHSHLSNIKIEKHFKKLAQEKGEEIFPNVYLPSPLLEVEFTVRHAAIHFAAGELTIRQILDFILLAEKKHSQIDWGMFWSDAKMMGMDQFVQAIIDIAISYLNFDDSKLRSSLPHNNEMANKVLQDIFHPDYTGEKPNGFLLYTRWMIKRWWTNRWKHEIVYTDSLLSPFFVQMWSHLLKPSSLKN